MAEREALTAEYVRQILDYNPDTGVFTWRMRPREHFASNRAHAAWNARFVNKMAGGICGKGYRLISIDNYQHLAHRLAWLYVTGEWPKEEVDHIDCKPENNSWDNLREASRLQNVANMRISQRNTSGIKGVSWEKRFNRWHARTRVNGKTVHLGYYKSKDDAALAYRLAISEIHGAYARIK